MYGVEKTFLENDLYRYWGEVLFLRYHLYIDGIPGRLQVFNFTCLAIQNTKFCGTVWFPWPIFVWRSDPMSVRAVHKTTLFHIQTFNYTVLCYRVESVNRPYNAYGIVRPINTWNGYNECLIQKQHNVFQNVLQQ